MNEMINNHSVARKCIILFNKICIYDTVKPATTNISLYVFTYETMHYYI